MSNTENDKLPKKLIKLGIKIQKQPTHASKSNDPLGDFMALVDFFKNAYDDTSILKSHKKDQENTDFHFENLTYESLFKFEMAVLTQLEMFDACGKLLRSLIINAKGDLRHEKNE